MFNNMQISYNYNVTVSSADKFLHRLSERIVRNYVFVVYSFYFCDWLNWAKLI